MPKAQTEQGIGEDELTLEDLEMERWLPQTMQAMRKLRVPGRGAPERYATLLRSLASKGSLHASKGEGRKGAPPARGSQPRSY